MCFLIWDIVQVKLSTATGITLKFDTNSSGKRYHRKFNKQTLLRHMLRTLMYLHNRTNKMFHVEHISTLHAC